MQINTLTPNYSVAGQIAPSDMAALKAAGFTAVICNRPDGEVGSDQDSGTMARAAEAAGLPFTYNPVVNGALTEDNVATQGAAISRASGPVFAYCRSGMRSSVVWALSQAGHIAPDDLIQAAAQGGYDIAGLRPQLDATAQR